MPLTFTHPFFPTNRSAAAKKTVRPARNVQVSDPKFTGRQPRLFCATMPRNDASGTRVCAVPTRATRVVRREVPILPDHSRVLKKMRDAHAAHARACPRALLATRHVPPEIIPRRDSF